MIIAILCVVRVAGFFGVSAQAGEIPTITLEPQPQTAFVGANVNLSVSATPNVGLRYRWRFNGTNLPATFTGQNTSLLTITNAKLSSAGPYSVVVSNSFGAVTSATAIVSINPPTGFGVGYVNLTAPPGYSLFTTPLVTTGPSQTVAGQLTFVADGSSLFRIDGNGFLANNFLDGWSAPQMLFSLGEGWFFHNPATNMSFVTVVGGILQGHLTNRLPAALSLCASLVPQSGTLSSTLLFPQNTDALIWRLNKTSQTFEMYSLIAQVWDPFEPSMDVGESFYVQESAAIDWVRDFGLDGQSTPPIAFRFVRPALASQTAEINFFTYHPDPALGRILDLDGVTPVNSDFMGQLYSGPTNIESVLSPIGQPVPFLSGAGAGYIRSSTIKLPGVPGGNTVHLQLRVWERCAGDTYEQALANGSAHSRSPLFTAVSHATIENGMPGLPPGNANNFPSTSVVLAPEVPLRVARIQSNGGVVELCWGTRPGATYRVQRASDFTDPMNWATVPGGNNIPGNGRVAHLLDPSGPQSFYRVLRIN